ncbi:hypothetical protein [Arthrobacter mobilis]|uniref:Uncharacterized protein n=1 Tax=Arthrobacter mobilis TaxID=2724944 RepID=A0A7X6K741_9MICC|nr:hypothetical protein [Arthrobacter mobilis]NKX56377.1 hypothetical protein [Arthrobacter mobilis]
MPATDAGRGGGPGGKTENGKPKVPLWQKPLLWVGAVVLAAAAAALTGWLEPLFTRLIGTASETGEPVTVIISSPEHTWGDVTLPPEVKLSPAELERLGRMNVPDQAAWLQDRGGIIAGNRRFLLTLKGNRQDPVRITGIRDASECSEPRRGTLLRLIPEAGGVVPSIELGISVGETGSGAWTTDARGEQHPFFPQRTITLARGEEEQLLVELWPSVQGQVCRPRLDMTVLEDGREHLQRIPAEGELVPVMRYEDDSVEPEYAAVYLGGRLCPEYVPAAPGWRFNTDFRQTCGLDRQRG